MLEGKVRQRQATGIDGTGMYLGFRGDGKKPLEGCAEVSCYRDGFGPTIGMPFLQGDLKRVETL